MRFKRHTELERGLHQIDVTPIIDMVFQLLIFFMLTSSFIMQSAVKVNLPKAVTSEVNEKENLVLAVSRENVLYLDKRVLTGKELKDVLTRAYKNKKAVLIMADRHANLGRVVEIWDIAREIGIEEIDIATER